MRFVLLAILGCLSPCFSQFTYPGCANLAATDFREVVLVGRSSSVNGVTPLAIDANLTEPVGMYVHTDGKVYWAERSNIGNSNAQNGVGRIKVFDPSTNTVTTVLTLATSGGTTNGVGGNEAGVRYVTLHPNFNVNRWAYVQYMPRAISTGRNVDTTVLSRFVVMPNGMFDSTSEKKFLKMAWTPGVNHHGGGLDWDAQGNLYIATGHNTERTTDYAPMNSALLGTAGENKDRATQDDQAHSANTMDWRGKLLRIHPDSSAKGYSIPSGNLRQRFYEVGGSWVAGQDTNKILPEIYSFGFRNPYSISVDKRTGWVTIGDMGPDAAAAAAASGPAGGDDFDLITKPSFNGWPYFIGPNRGYNMWNPSTNNYSLPVQSPDTVYNNSPNNNGVTRLPTALASILSESRNGALNTGVAAAFGTTGGMGSVTGPIYHYNDFPASSKKWPPHLEGKWIIAESARNNVYVATPNSAGTAVTDLQVIPGSATVFRPSGTVGIIDMKMGPEGALYLIHYSGNWTSGTTTRISRVEYAGTCSPATVSIVGSRADIKPIQKLIYTNLGDGTLFWPVGMKRLTAFDLQGKILWSAMRQASENTVSIPAGLRSDLLKVRYVQ